MESCSPAPQWHKLKFQERVHIDSSFKSPPFVIYNELVQWVQKKMIQSLINSAVAIFDSLKIQGGRIRLGIIELPNSNKNELVELVLGQEAPCLTALFKGRKYKIDFCWWEGCLKVPSEFNEQLLCCTHFLLHVNHPAPGIVTVNTPLYVLFPKTEDQLEEDKRSYAKNLLKQHSNSIGAAKNDMIRNCIVEQLCQMDIGEIDPRLLSRDQMRRLHQRLLTPRTYKNVTVSSINLNGISVIVYHFHDTDFCGKLCITTGCFHTAAINPDYDKCLFHAITDISIVAEMEIGFRRFLQIEHEEEMDETHLGKIKEALKNPDANIFEYDSRIKLTLTSQKNVKVWDAQDGRTYYVCNKFKLGENCKLISRSTTCSKCTVREYNRWRVGLIKFGVPNNWVYSSIVPEIPGKGQQCFLRNHQKIGDYGLSKSTPYTVLEETTVDSKEEAESIRLGYLIYILIVSSLYNYNVNIAQAVVRLSSGAWNVANKMLLKYDGLRLFKTSSPISQTPKYEHSFKIADGDSKDRKNGSPLIYLIKQKSKPIVYAGIVFSMGQGKRFLVSRGHRFYLLDKTMARLIPNNDRTEHVSLELNHPDRMSNHSVESMVMLSYLGAQSICNSNWKLINLNSSSFVYKPNFFLESQRFMMEEFKFCIEIRKVNDVNRTASRLEFAKDASLFQQESQLCGFESDSYSGSEAED